jgi:hypothetical protein
MDQQLKSQTMSGINDQRSAQLRQFFAVHSDATILRHFLGGIIPGAPLYLSTCAIVCLDLEWFYQLPHKTLEIGIAEFFPSAEQPTIHAENHLSNIHVAHARLMNDSLYVNKFKGAGNPDDFQFGTSRYVKTDEAREVLLKTFCRLDSAGQKQPVILLMHGAAAKHHRLIRDFDFDLQKLGTIVKIN